MVFHRAWENDDTIIEPEMYLRSPKVNPPIIPPVMYMGSILKLNEEFRKNNGKCQEAKARAVNRRINLGFILPLSNIP